MAAKLFRQWKSCWINLIPKAVECLEKDFDRLIPFFSARGGSTSGREFSPEFHRVIRTTNVIERSFEELRRRLKVMGYFSRMDPFGQNTRSCNRMIYNLCFYFNNKWERKTERIRPIAQYFDKAA